MPVTSKSKNIPKKFKLLEAILTCCIPNLKFNFLSPKLDGFDLEIYADGGDEGGVESIF